MLLSVGGLVVSGANIISMTLSDGNVGLGIAGATIGSTLVGYTLIKDAIDESEKGPFLAVGTLTFILGTANIFVGRHEPNLLGMRIDPSVLTLDNQRWFGLQVSRSW